MRCVCVVLFYGMMKREGERKRERGGTSERVCFHLTEMSDNNTTNNMSVNNSHDSNGNAQRNANQNGMDNAEATPTLTHNQNGGNMPLPSHVKASLESAAEVLFQRGRLFIFRIFYNARGITL